MRRRLTLAALCLLAFALSCAYVHFYLRGGPRVIDATSYFLEAKGLAIRTFTFFVASPSASFRGRFLLADGNLLGVIFPPGYPLVLALGVKLGAPMLVGPLLGAALVFVTYRLALALGQSAKVAMLAAALSVLSAALRYHTADTMSHGLTTLLGCTALWLALEPRIRRASLLAGLCVGLAVATRPVSGAVTLLLVLLAAPRSVRTWTWLALGMLPGIGLLLLQQRALTGSYFGSTQLAYYAASDAPAGCFRYGFGAGIGCRYEHGDYVTRFLPDGFGAAHALRNLGVHLWLFLTDATNAVPLTLLALVALVRHRRTPLWLLGVGIALQALAYVPFYFDGNYPGGGARFLCEAIPLAQILVARAAWDLRLGWLAVPLSLAGFGLYAQRAHATLRDSQGGRPMFEARVLEQAGVKRGLVFVDTDHGFNLGFDPAVGGTRTGFIIARRRGDAHDYDLYEHLSAPTYRYIFDSRGLLPPRLEPFVPPPSWRYEAEAEWPAELERGSAYPTHFPCASQGRALRLLPGTLAHLPLDEHKAVPVSLRVGWVAKTSVTSTLRLRWGKDVWQTLVTPPGPGCSELRVTGQQSTRGGTLLVELVSGEGAVDYVEAVR
jgi:hypothetical protein